MAEEISFAPPWLGLLEGNIDDLVGPWWKRWCPWWLSQKRVCREVCKEKNTNRLFTYNKISGSGSWWFHAMKCYAMHIHTYWQFSIAYPPTNTYSFWEIEGNQRVWKKHGHIEIKLKNFMAARFLLHQRVHHDSLKKKNQTTHTVELGYPKDWSCLSNSSARSANQN